MREGEKLLENVEYVENVGNVVGGGKGFSSLKTLENALLLF